MLASHTPWMEDNGDTKSTRVDMLDDNGFFMTLIDPQCNIVLYMPYSVLLSTVSHNYIYAQFAITLHK